MPRYWVIAPVESYPAELFNKVWQFDVANNLISIGWHELGDTSKMSREALSNAITAAYPDKPPATKGLIVNMLWAFYHEVAPSDFVIARRGRKILAASGKVVGVGFYAPGKNPILASPDANHPNFLEVEWQAQPRDKVFPTLVFPMHTLAKISEDQYNNLLSESEIITETGITESPIQERIDQSAFVLEKYLEDLIVSNFKTIFKGKLNIYDADGADGQQYSTEIGTIDILAVEPESNSLMVIEIKKGRPSDQVVGQILRYMGWIKKNICK